MKNSKLMQAALEATQKNVRTKKSRKSVNDHLFEMLYTEARELDRIEILNEITFKRYEDEIEEITDENISKVLKSKDWAKIQKTAKNGIDSAVCNGSTSASFNANKNYANYELIKDGNKFAIIKR